jgi:hypothetical protein
MGSVLVEEYRMGGVVGETIDMTGQLLARAQGGDGEAFAELTGPFSRELQVHCYRILGSVADAEALTGSKDVRRCAPGCMRSPPTSA